MGYTKEQATQNRQVTSLARCLLNRCRFPTQHVINDFGQWSPYSQAINAGVVAEIQTAMPEVPTERITPRVWREMSAIVTDSKGE